MTADFYNEQLRVTPPTAAAQWFRLEQLPRRAQRFPLPFTNPISQLQSGKRSSPIEIKRMSTTSIDCSHKCTVFEHFQQICVDCGGVLTDVLFGTQALDRATDYNSGVGDYVFGK